MRRVTAAAMIGAALLLAAGCSSSSSSSTTSGTADPTGSTTSAAAAAAPVTVRLGFLENITHASALVALKEGYFSKALGSAGTVQPTAFSTGTEETTALLAGQLDAAYVGPNPAINAWQKSGGTAIKIVSGAADGGASVVVAKGITSAAQLKGKTLATPSLGNTQDVALRYWLKQNGIATTATGGGDAFIKPTTPNSAAVLEFKSGQIAGGSEPAPYDIEMVADGGTVLYTEPGGRRGPHQGPDPGQRVHQFQPDRGPGGRERRACLLHRQAAQVEPGGGRVQGDHLHQRPGRVLADQRRVAGRLARPAQAGQPERHLRPRTAQPGAGCGRAASDQFVGGGFMARQGNSTMVTGQRSVVEPVTGAVGSVRLTGVSKVFGRGGSAVRALDQISLEVPSGEFTCLIGASGCGKSTLLNLVAGLDQPTSGAVSVSGRVALMFQEPALFPWLTAAGNIDLALRARGQGRVERRQRTTELLEVVRLGAFGGKRPHELSGGMRQRVALARALAQDADVLLMDEPFGALDAMTRDLLHDELDRVCAGRQLTIIFVTHNVREAVRLGDRVVVLSSRPGRVIDEFAVPIEHPRRIDSAPVAELAGQITDRLREEMSHGTQ
jgi:NitT/TauT family transport system ATP-binding protein